MILFKRVGESFRHIEDREWVLLFLETLGVLAGILLAFELQEWAQRRSDAAKHHQLMERLLEETELDIGTLRYMRDRIAETVKHEQSFAVELSNNRCPAANEWEAAQTFNIMPALTAPSSVYEELKGAGGLSSIERKDVRKSLAQFHDDLDWSQQQITYFREFHDEPVPTSDPRKTIRFDPTKEEPEVATFDRTALCADHEFKNKVAAAARSHTVFMSYPQGALEDAIDTCVRLAHSLGKTCIPASGGPLKGADAAFANKVFATMRKDLASN